LIRRVERAEIDFDLVIAAAKDRGTATRTKMPVPVGARFALDRHRVLGENR